MGLDPNMYDVTNFSLFLFWSLPFVIQQETMKLSLIPTKLLKSKESENEYDDEEDASSGEDEDEQEGSSDEDEQDISSYPMADWLLIITTGPGAEYAG